MSLLSSLLHQAAGPLTWLLLLAIVFIPLERLFSLRKAPILRPEALTDLGWFFVNGIGTKILVSLVAAALAVAAHKAMPSALLDAVAALPLAVRLPLAIVIGDIGAYWGHRWLHEHPILWRLHAVHHSARHIDWLVNTRTHPLDVMVVRFCGMVPIYALGLDAAGAAGTGQTVLAAYAVIGTLMAFLVHANVRWNLRWIEPFIATPRFHHWHHTNDSREVLDKNYAAIFPWVDRMFGTLYLPADGRWPQVYGTDTPMPDDLIGQLVQPFKPQAAVAETAPR